MSKFFERPPSDFKKAVEVSTVFMECADKILLLQRCEGKIQSNTWCIPGGKLERGEAPLEGLVREIEEELYLFPDPLDLHFVKTVYVRHSTIDYVLHLFKWTLDTYPEIKINSTEHRDFIWQPISQFNHVPLLEGQLEAYNFMYKH